ncbi:hypothetical protein PHYSODRAFT_294173 [Phytophthora sojae]|uniref:Uncharacterized protein n=1 Tax=Phytophthora sojae (strain P6497) TaxID=1094619 RepID=G4YG87_PHYSP|nr:hypothetical protein PHYSODRAFT_294173 [Phytophthora sojae]EGZ28699.1 hypothetical protein PHYSODRAFT_294173 [Phytophthora sojae]|eukprot:XP_009515974.1 hypothetical protein PHYSODRAFT_294173 [Phytophthora sojae]
MVVEWEVSSWADNEAVLAAVEIETRLKASCDENDTVALAFTSAAISDTIDAYLEGEVKANDAVATARRGQHGCGICLRNASTATTPHSSFGDMEVLVPRATGSMTLALLSQSSSWQGVLLTPRISDRKGAAHSLLFESRSFTGGPSLQPSLRKRRAENGENYLRVAAARALSYELLCIRRLVKLQRFRSWPARHQHWHRRLRFQWPRPRQRDFFFFVRVCRRPSDHEEPIDVMLVANSSVSSSWLDSVVSYTAAAESRVLYQAASWTLLDEGTQSGKFASYWARFQAVNRTKKPSGQFSPSAGEMILSLSRLRRLCRRLLPVSYLKGDVAVNGVVAALKLHIKTSSMAPEASNRMFVRLVNGICPRDESATAFSGLNSTSAPVISLVRGVACSPGPDSHLGPPPQPSSQGNSYEADWKHNLRVIIPVVIIILVFGCAGFVYVRRQKNGKASSANEAPEEENPEEDKGEKEDASSQPYVLATQPIV